MGKKICKKVIKLGIDFNIWYLWLLIIPILGLLSITKFSPYWWTSVGMLILLIRFYLYYIYKYIRCNKKEGNIKFLFLKSMSSFIQSSLKSILLFITLIIVFFTYQGLTPAQMSSHTISNGDKSIVFIEMAHIGTKGFYDRVNQQVKDLSEDNYTLYFESVDIDVSEEEVSKSLGFNLNKDTYKTLTSILGDKVVEQDNGNIILSAKKSVRADVKYSELLDYEKETVVSNKKSVKNNNKTDIETDNIFQKNTKITENEKKEIEDTINNLGELEKRFYGFLFTGYVNFLIKNPDIYNLHQKILYSYIANGGDNSFFEKRVIHYRNQKLAEKIINSKDKKIVITYGQLHFKGFLEELKKLDNSYTIIKEKKNYLF